MAKEPERNHRSTYNDGKKMPAQPTPTPPTPSPKPPIPNKK